MGSITGEQILAALTGGAALSNAIFFGAYFLGKFMSRLERVEAKVDEHEKIITGSKVFKGI